MLMMMILPWFTIPLLGKTSFKRFLPSAIFISLIVSIVHFIAKQRKWWWWWYEKIHPKEPGGVPFIFGPYLVGTLWILKWTYGKFSRYIILNLIIDGAFTYGLVNYLQKFGIASLVRMKKIQLVYVFMNDALLLYGFQFFNDKVIMKRV